MVFQFLFLNFRLQFCYLAMLGFTQNWVTDCGYMRKVHWFFSFYSSTSGRRACPAYPVLLPRNARLYAKLARGLWMHEEGSWFFSFYCSLKIKFAGNINFLQT